MRNYYFIAAIVGLLLMGCSVNNDEMSFNNDQIKTVNSVWEVDGCESMIYEFHSSLGEFIITNDNDNLYLNFLANDGFLIYDIRWEAMPSEADLPINANGINSSRLDQRDKFDSGIAYHGETVPISDFGVDPGYVIVAAEVILKNSLDQKFTAWVGNESDFRNGSNYLVYDICDPSSDPICEANAGSDNSRTYTFSEVDALVNDLGDIEALYKTLLDEGVSRDGTFSPTGLELLRAFNRNPYRGFTTVYTVSNDVGGVKCTDSTELTITVTPD
ncbi:hypothetical protein [Christiangramia gaetbulicola]|nr:hypothetical protein [Christiangramia gaetbulicola]